MGLEQPQVQDGQTPAKTQPAPRLSPAWRIAGASISMSALTIWLGLLGLITTPIMIHYLGTTRYGVFALIAITSAYLMNLEFGFGTATTRFLARAFSLGDREAQSKIFGTSLAVFVSGGLVAAGLAFTGAPWIAHNFFHGPSALRSEATDAVRIGALILLFSFLTSLASCGLQAVSRISTLLVARLVFGTLSSAGAVAAVLVGGHLRLVLATQAAVSAGLCITLFASLLRTLEIRSRPHADRATFRSMASYGSFILISGLGTEALMQGPPTVLAHAAPTAAVAAFAVPNTILQQLANIGTSTSVGFMPFASAASVDSDRTHLAALFRSNLRISLLCLGPVTVFLAIFAHRLLAAWISPRFAAHAASPLQFLSLAALMLAMNSAPGDVARGLGHARWIALYTVSAAVVAIGASIVTAPRHGAAGVAFALALALTVTTVPFIALVSGRLLETPMRVLVSALLRPLLVLGLLAALFGAVAATDNGLVIVLVTGAVGMSAYAAVAYRFVLAEREQAAFRLLRRRLLHRNEVPA